LVVFDHFMMADVVKYVHPDVGISTAVGFLEDVSKQNWNEADLRRYLLGTRGLSNDQVKEAFKIHRAKSSRRSRHSSQDNIKFEGIEPPKGSRRSRASSRDNITMEDEKSPFSGSADRPELPAATSRPKISKLNKKVARANSSYLVSSKKAEGEELIQEFLICEKGYCGVLECLNDEYLRELLWQAGRGTINIRQQELQELFSHIPKLVNFHKSFYNDLMLGSNIGRLFIRRLSFFKAYGVYIKDVTAIIEMLRKHVFDKKLHKCFGSIRRRSRLSKNDLTDLLLTPLDRILDYKFLLDSLYQFADKAQTVDYQFFAKAARRLGRVAKYIEKYRHGVINRSEMNRVQQYLGNQCYIISPQRSIVRRGVITRRTTGWTARNKKYHFFLFTDVLLWTSKSGILRKVVKLSTCKLCPSDSRYEKDRKFRILIDMKDQNPKAKNEVKVLHLECQTEKQRDTWYRSLEDAICSANATTAQSLPVDEIDYTMENDSDDEESSKKTTLIDDESYSGKKKLSRGNASEDWGSQTLALVNAPYHDRYESHNFIEQKFQEFEPMDDTESQSDYDHSFFEKFGEYDGVPRTSLMSPHRISSQAVFENEKPISKQRDRGNGNRGNGTVQSPSSCVIKRSESITFKSSDDDNMDVKRTSSFTVRLSDGIIAPDANFIISLSGLDDGVYV